MPKTLSREAEDQIIAGVKQAAELVNDDGLHPDDAIEKVARALQWGPEMVRFASFAYNTGKQNAQMESAKSALDKFADFPLADPDRINSRIWPAKVKAAGDVLPVSAEYSKPPVFPRQRAEAEKQASFRHRVKVASEAAACKACGKSPCTCKTANYRDVAWQHSQLKLAAETARQSANSAYDRLAASMRSLNSYFAKSAYDRLAFADVELAVSTYHGDSGQKLMDWVHRTGRLKEARAGSPGVKYAGSAYEPDQEPYRTVNRCLEQASIVRQKRAAEAAAYQTVEQFVHSDLVPMIIPATKTASWDAVNGEQVKTTYGVSAAQLAMYMPSPRMKVAGAVPFAPAQPAKTGGSWSLLSGLENEKTADGPLSMVIPSAVGSTTKQLLENAMTNKQDSDPVDKAWLELEDPRHDAELRKIRTQAMMADMMNDPVIGGYDPEHVSQAYNEMSQLAPRSGQQPAVVRAALRRSLQGNMQPFETRDTLDTENSLKGTTGIMPGPGEGKGNGNAAKSILK